MQFQRFASHSLFYILALGIGLFLLKLLRQKELSDRKRSPDFLAGNTENIRSISFRYFINNTVFQHRRTKWPLKSCSQRLVILVNSQVTDIEQRNSIRMTWGQWLSYANVETSDPGSARANFVFREAKLIFVVGSSSNHNKTLQEQDIAALRHEAIHDDVAHIPEIQDSYRNISLKTLVSLNLLRSQCRRARFFFKVDSDCFVNVPRLLQLAGNISELSRTIPLIVGHVFYQNPVDRNSLSKWFIPYHVFSAKYYPTYVSGFSYLMSRAAVDTVLRRSVRERWLYVWEDVLISGLLAGDAVRLVDHPGFMYERGGPVPGCLVMRMVSVHRIWNTERLQLWNLLHSTTDSSLPDSCLDDQVLAQMASLYTDQSLD